MKSSYNNLGEALGDISKAVNDFYNADTNTFITNEFVRWNDVNMFQDTGQSRVDVKTQSNYKDGEVIGRNPYFEYVYYGTSRMPAGGKSGKPRPFEYTAQERVNDLTKIQVNLLNKKLKG